MVGELFHRQQAGDVLGQQTEQLGVVLFTHDVHLALHVGLDGIEFRRQLGTESLPVGRGLGAVGVEHLVEQQGMAGEKLCTPARRAHEVGNPAQGLGVLLQQGEIGPAPADRVHQVEEAREGVIRTRGGGSGLDDARDEGVETALDVVRQLTVARAGVNRGQALGTGAGVAVAQGLQCRHDAVDVLGASPGGIQAVVLFRRVAEHGVEVKADHGAVSVQGFEQGGVVGKAHGLGDQRLVSGLGR